MTQTEMTHPPSVSISQQVLQPSLAHFQPQPSYELADVMVQSGLAYIPSWLLLVSVYTMDWPSPALPPDPVHTC